MKNSAKKLIAYLKRFLNGLKLEHTISEAENRPEWDFQLIVPVLKKRFFIEIVSTVYPQIVMERSALANAQGVEVILLTAHVSRKTFELCREKRVNIISAEGNTCLRSMPLCIDTFQEKRRRPEGTSGTVFTPRSSRVVRAMLCVPEKVWTQQELTRTVAISQGQVSKVLKRLHEQGFIYYDGTARILDPDRLLEEWASHYRFDRHRRRVFAFSASGYEQGLRLLAERLRTHAERYALTGTSGAYLRAPYSTGGMYTAYVSGSGSGTIPGLYPVEKEGNVVFYEPQDEGVYQFGATIENIEVVSDVQLYVDLYRMPGRATDQAEYLRKTLLNFKVD